MLKLLTFNTHFSNHHYHFNNFCSMLPNNIIFWFESFAVGYIIISRISMRIMIRTVSIISAGTVCIADGHLSEIRKWQSNAFPRYDACPVPMSAFNCLNNLLHRISVIVCGKDAGGGKSPVQVHLSVEPVNVGKVPLRRIPYAKMMSVTNPGVCQEIWMNCLVVRV